VLMRKKESSDEEEEEENSNERDDISHEELKGSQIEFKLAEFKKWKIMKEKEKRLTIIQQNKL